MNTINTYFGKIYCINLDKRLDRWEESQKEFQKINIEVERYSAFDGNKIKNVENLFVGHFEKAGQFGCLISHLNIIKKAKESKIPSVVILEDDVVFCDNFNQEFNLSMIEMPKDWDMIFFGSNHVHSPIKISDRICKLRRAYSAHCYVIRDRMYDELIGLIEPMNEPLDVTYANIQSTHNCYVFNPHLVWQRPGYSDICEMVVDYTHVHKISL
jgi:GR25 family glycosyltransferase involved in LPS biosynthesis